MIERKIVREKIKEHEIEEYIRQNLKNVGHSFTRVQKTPLGEKIIIHAARQGLVVGKKGENIKKLTGTLKKKFGLENPEIEIAEVEHPMLDARIVAEKIVNSIERFGIQKFKAIAHKSMQEVKGAGALGIEIRMSGKIPSSRAKSWRFCEGYLKKCGNEAMIGVSKAYGSAQLKSGTVGIQVRIMPPDLKLPDDVEVRKHEEGEYTKQEKIEEEQKKTEKPAVEDKPKKQRKPRKKKTTEEKAEKPAEESKETPQ
ncbi:MAG: 30S ribosomal protein S3 [Nanoarchaeota archaeon]